MAAPKRAAIFHCGAESTRWQAEGSGSGFVRAALVAKAESAFANDGDA
jgi:hypothetical protein